jgi:hypothetical protein
MYDIVPMGKAQPRMPIYLSAFGHSILASRGVVAETISAPSFAFGPLGFVLEQRTEPAPSFVFGLLGFVLRTTRIKALSSDGNDPLQAMSLDRLALF